MSELVICGAHEDARITQIKMFCHEFMENRNRPRYVFGCNVYGNDIVKYCSINGFIDDFSSKSIYCGQPVVKTTDVPKDAMVLVASGGKPLTARKILRQLGIENLDYFSFQKWSGLPLKEIVFNENFSEDFSQNEAQHRWIHSCLADQVSKQVYRQLVSFRLQYDLDIIEDFTDRQDEQYFEDFLALQPSNEVFVDVGGFDGYTSLEFIKRCPSYRAIHIFEPDPDNFVLCKQNLERYSNVFVWKMGASNKRGTLSFSTSGSASSVHPEGTLSITVDRLDDMLSDPPSMIKIDIEGGEMAALEGAKNFIANYHPRLAISVYHKFSDFWRIPQQILQMYSDYDIFLRHYTESIYETVMFFIPRSGVRI